MAALLERESVLRSLLSHVERASARQGRLVLLYGEAGIGKTSVVRSLAERIGPDARVLVGSCDPLTTPRPLGPLVDIAPRLGPAVARSMEGAANGAAPPNTVFAALLDELDRSSRPTVIVFEDVHWADSGTFDLLRYLGRRISATPATLIATYRDDEVGPAHPFSVVLGDLAHTASTHREGLDRLSPHAVRALASAAAPAATHRADADELYRVTGGNPFFVTELLAAGAAGTPASIRDAVLGRVARLSPESRRVVDVVAVLGSPAPAQVLHAVLGDGYGLAVESAVQSGVLVAAGLAVSFRHELARQAVLAAVADIRRFELSGRALAAMRGPDVSPDELPRLAALAEDAGDKPAVREFALRAARRATSLGAHREAAAQYSRALRHAGAHRGHRRAELLEGQAYSLYLIDQIPAAEAAWREAAGLRREEGDRLREGDDVRWASYMLWLLGRNDEARSRKGCAPSTCSPPPARPCRSRGPTRTSRSSTASPAISTRRSLPRSGPSSSAGRWATSRWRCARGSTPAWSACCATTTAGTRSSRPGRPRSTTTCRSRPGCSARSRRGWRRCTGTSRGPSATPSGRGRTAATTTWTCSCASSPRHTRWGSCTSAGGTTPRPRRRRCLRPRWAHR
ncbi:ATP-binding protein [Pseudonocardia sp. TRM90224]|uniref:ATP-binding protein n=1 Tax=Pseudonocardia sp. TRM90224 TaxID=2812678 RepID=UPI001E3AB239|nr:AAA family ATPase [Pseudonocardia sp. TRM90224]